MLAYVINRLLVAFPVLALVSLGTFSMVYLIPGDAASTVAGEGATVEEIAAVRARLGLDRPLLEQFADWLGGVVTGDLGTSVVYNVPVLDFILQRAGNTISLVLLGMLFAFVIGLPLGLIAGLRVGSLPDRLLTPASSLGLAVPTYWFGMILVVVFALQLGLFPATGYVPFVESPAGWFRSLFLPALAIAATSAAEIARQTRASVADTMLEDHVKVSRSRGLSTRNLIGRHILRNSGVPVITVLGFQVERMLGAVVVIEIVFGMTGVGKLLVESVRAQDLPTLQGVILIIAVVVILTNLIIDLSYAWIEPRLRKS